MPPKPSLTRKASGCAKPRGSHPVRGQAAALANRTPVERVYHIHAAVATGGFPNCARLARELKVTSKTIQRDITFMRENLGLPICYEDTKHGFHYTRPVGELPCLNLGADELAALFLMRVASAGGRGNKLIDVLTASLQRITRPLQDRFTFGWEEIDAALLTKDKLPTSAQIDIFQKLAHAVQERREVEVSLKNPTVRKPEVRHFQPLHLGEIKGNWVLVGADMNRNAIRVIPVARLGKVRVKTARFKRPEPFDARPMLAPGFNLRSEDGGNRDVFEVRIRAEGQAAALASTRLWDISQEITELNAKGTRIEINLKANNLPETAKWVIFLGSGAQVIAPPALSKAVKETVKNLGRIA